MHLWQAGRPKSHFRCQDDGPGKLHDAGWTERVDPHLHSSRTTEMAVFTRLPSVGHVR